MLLSPALRNRRRIEMRLAAVGLPEVFLVGRYNYTQAGPPLAEHTHGDLLEVCYLVKGRQTYRAGKRNHHLRGGDVFVAFPHERHSTAGNPEEKGVLYWIMLKRTGRTLFGLPASTSAHLWNSLCHLPRRHFRGSARMKSQLDAITALFHEPRSPLQTAALTVEALGFFLEVLRCARAGSDTENSGQRMARICRYIEDHLEEPLSVPDLAAQARLSVPRFKALFKEETGVPPGEYVLRAKIAEARRRLESGRSSITEVAHALEFSSSQYFATVFKRYTGQTPSAVRERFAKGRNSPVR
jgi:AraC-like DNA-binding protein